MVKLQNKQFYFWTLVGGSLNVLLIAMLQTSTIWQPAQYVWTYLPLLVLCGICTLLSAFLWLRPSAILNVKQNLTPVTAVIVTVSAMVILGFVWSCLPPLTSEVILSVPQLYLTGLITVLLTQIISFPVAGQWRILFPIALIIVGVVTALLLSGRVPHLVDYDEPGEINLSISLVDPPGFRWGLYPHMSAAEVSLSYSFLNVLAGLWLKALGIGIAQGRLFFLSLTWISVPFIFLTARRLFGFGAGIAAAIIAVFIPLTDIFIRPDGWVATTTSVALYFYFVSRSSPPILARLHIVSDFLVGLAVGLGLEGHPYAVRFILVFTALYFIEYIQAWRTTHHLWHRPFYLFILGGLVSGAIYLYLHVGLSGTYLFDIPKMYSGIYSTQRSYSIRQNFWEHLILDNFVILQIYVKVHLGEVLLLMIGLWWAIRVPQIQAWRLLGIWSSSVVIGLLLLAHPNYYYIIYNLPFIAILVGGAIQGIRTKSTVKADFYVKVTVTIVMLLGTAFTLLRKEDPAIKEYALGKTIESMFPASMSIIGPQVYYLSMIDRPRFYATEIINHPDLMNSIGRQFALVVRVDSSPDAEFDLDTIMVSTYLMNTKLERVYCLPKEGTKSVEIYMPERPTEITRPDLLCKNG